ncbi:bacteriocin fulvocin C-related protein [Actinokineospora globicatena]|uniref:Bacteriocin fulvocin C-related protein n=1 Tax=Actinokineospora globicatena TaxID=103729 RepID=A0A9W6QQC1_9PSEU|nr:bacteriocin fulvocin C-related protein [Actinokineospora globicatena]GLW93732.1 hypothetical protein Aglo03_45480 [Actinokineospora globicatena]
MSVIERRWVLAFDASCGKCRKVSAAVERACDGKLEVLPLTHPDVAGWRARAFTDAPWEPTLLLVEGDRVRGWHGRAMTVPLVRMLGVRASLRVVGALGELRYSTAEGGVGRQRFLRLGAGVAIATGLVATGSVPAFAASDDAKARAWVAANRGSLPITFDEITAYPIAYRKAILASLSPAERSALWSEQVNRYRLTHPDLTAEQRAFLDEALAVAGRSETFQDEASEEVAAQLTRLHDEGIRVLGFHQAASLLAVFGPAEQVAVAAGALNGCTCNKLDDWCAWGYHCRDGSCGQTPQGCGTYYGQPCNGLCYD